MGEDVDPMLLEEVERHEQFEKSILESVRENLFTDLAAASKNAPKVEKPEPVKIEYPVPPSLEDLERLLEEVKDELVQTEATKQSTAPKETVSSTPATDLISRAVEHIAKEIKLEEDSFQQPTPSLVDKNIEAVQKKLKFLEQAIGKIAATGPGSGEVELKRLDDVDFASVSGAVNNQVLSYNATSKLWVARSVTSGGGGIALTDLSVTVNTPSGNGYLTYDDNTGVFNFTPANLSLKANIADLTTANVVELTNLYFTNARSVAAFTPGSNITIESNGRISASVNTPAQLQSDWNQTDTSNVTFILNKPNVVTDIISTDNTVQVSMTGNGIHDLSVAASLSTSVDKVFAYVTNDDAVTIHKGDPVYLHRATGNRPSVILANSTSDQYSAKTLGLASQDINPGNPGWVQTQGVLTGINTSAYAEGDTLYLSPTSGTLTNVKPHAPQHLVYIGVVVRANQGQGQIYIRPQNGYELDEIHDVNIGHTYAKANGQVLIYNTSNNLWENKHLSVIQNNGNSLSIDASGKISITGNVFSITGGVTANATTAFTAGDAAISGVALAVPREGGIRNSHNGLNNMYFDVSTGGTTHGQFQFRSSSNFTNILTMSPTAFNVNPEAVVTAKTSSFGRLPWNSALDTELSIDDYRFRINNSGGNIYAQVISNTGGTKNSAWTSVAAISGQAVSQGGSTGSLLPNNSWTSLYTFASMNSAGDTVTVTFQDKNQGRIYRITFMRGDNGSTSGYNIIAERLL